MQIIFNFLHIYYAGVSTMIKKYRFFAEFYEHGENNGFDLFTHTNKQNGCFFQSHTNKTYKEMLSKPCQQ